jgi:hypothetical protein
MIFPSLSFFKCVFVESHFFVISFAGCQSHFGKFYFLSCTMVVVSMKGVRLIIAIDDLDWILEFKMLHLKQKCSIGMAPLIKLQA